MPKFVMLWTDVAMWLLIAAVVGYVLYVLRQPTLRASWRKVFMDAAALASSIVLVLCLVLTLLGGAAGVRNEGLIDAPGGQVVSAVAEAKTGKANLSFNAKDGSLESGDWAPGFPLDDTANDKCWQQPHDGRISTIKGG